MSATAPGPGTPSFFLAAACPCGRSLKIPAGLLGRRVRCPGCGANVDAPDRAGAGVPVADRALLATRTCTVCLARFEEGAAAVGCPACSVSYHAECWAENGGCGVFGCPMAPEPPEAPEEEEEGPVQTAWGDTKACPKCRKVIQAIAIKCRFCMADFGTRDPITPAEWKERARRQGTGSRTRTLAVVSFVCSALCFSLPVGAGISLYHLLDRRRRAELDDADRFLFIASASVAGLYLLLYFLFKVMGW